MKAPFECSPSSTECIRTALGHPRNRSVVHKAAERKQLLDAQRHNAVVRFTCTRASEALRSGIRDMVLNRDPFTPSKNSYSRTNSHRRTHMPANEHHIFCYQQQYFGRFGGKQAFSLIHDPCRNRSLPRSFRQVCRSGYTGAARKHGLECKHYPEKSDDPVAFNLDCTPLAVSVGPKSHREDNHRW